MRGNKYAVLICGDVATHYGFDEFWNDVVLMREVLMKNGFAARNIFVLYGDGSDFTHTARTNPRYLPPAGSPITNWAATTANVQMVFQGLATGDTTHSIPRMTADDFLFVWTFDHGNSSAGHALLCLRDGQMQDTTFATAVNAITYGYRVFAMQQCFSGGFVDDLSNDRTVVLTACSGSEVAYRADNSPTVENEVYGGVTYHHGEFNFHLFSALSHERIDYTNVAVDLSLDRFASMREVYTFIDANDTVTETTQFEDGTLDIGGWLTIERDTLVHVRDDATDTGQTPSTPPGGVFWDSPDIWVRNADDGGTAHQNPIAGQTNFVHARIHNRGVVGSGPVSVKFFCVDPLADITYPYDYTSLITWASVDTIAAGGEAIVKGPWIPAEISTLPTHACMLVEVYQHDGIPPVGTSPVESHNIAQKNLSIVTVTGGSTLMLPFLVGGPAITKLRPLLEVVQTSGAKGLEAWLEIRDKRWLEDLTRPAAPRGVTVAALSASRLRVGIPGDATASPGWLLNLAEGSEIVLDPGVEVAPEPTREAGTWANNRLPIDLLNPVDLTLPPILGTRKTLYLVVKVPALAARGAKWVIDVCRKDGKKRVGGLRFNLQVR